jgi:hypothetical protein
MEISELKEYISIIEISESKEITETNKYIKETQENSIYNNNDDFYKCSQEYIELI